MAVWILFQPGDAFLRFLLITTVSSSLLWKRLTWRKVERYVFFFLEFMRWKSVIVI